MTKVRPHITSENDRDWFVKTYVETGNVSRETFARLESVIDLLDERRSQINLIGPKEWTQIWRRHVADSLQLMDQIFEGATIVDFGSGGGFPGLILAAANPSGQLTMIESTGKKCGFLRDAISVASLSAMVRQGRVESGPHFDVDFVTARAFAPLPKLLDYAAPWLNGATGLFFKGQNWQEELTRAQQSWNFSYQTILSRTSDSGVILKIGELSRVGKQT